MMETANNAGEILTLPGIRERALTFSARVRDFLERDVYKRQEKPGTLDEISAFAILDAIHYVPCLLYTS